MHRALCPVETLYVGQRSRAVLSCTLRGPVDVAALSAAYDAMTQAHPGLRSRIEHTGTGHVLRLLDEDERPRLTLRYGDLEEVYGEELNRPLTVGGPLSRAVLVSAPDEQSHLFVLVIDHTVTDGHSSIALHNALWDRYRALVDGESAAEPGDPRWPEPVSRLLPPADEADTAQYLDGRLEEVRRHPVALVPYDAAPGDGTGGPQGRIEVRRLTLDADHTARLRRAARDAGVSVHAVVAAALLATARRRLDGDGPRTLGCLSPVDLRSRLSPPVPATALVPAVTTHLQTLDVTEDPDSLDLARTVHGRLSDFLARGDHFREMRITPEIPRTPALQLATVIATNMGVVPGPRLPEGLRAVDVRLVPAREQYFPQAGRSPVMACVVSFEGRLSIEFPHSTACFSPTFMRAFRDDVRAGLLRFTTAAPPRPADALTA
ncbi:phthiocerol/phthiodiolone dimycocerosyl transferase family protein [Streptomyces griseosporeus]|uniref:phthiocerol/phthiodiolone dimycocerosyl transferase family protein n=1 Tax=Streptomyces griseosporeus TaxID=1910 RepID=UPI0036F80CC3